ncbi:MAG: hypothetical protein JNM63_01670 [Spirochaetia bacterium]|nr:hypothetical protein [Spirochaetia bacterium]
MSSDFKNYRGSNADERVFYITDSENEDSGVALGIYLPKSDINQYPIVGVNEKTGKVVYKDSRIDENAKGQKGLAVDLIPKRTPILWKYGFNGQFTGMINRAHLPPDIYETFRSEYFILCGTPKQVKDAVAALEKLQSE